MGIYTVVVAIQVGLGLGLILLLGTLLRAFVDAYAHLAIGCSGSPSSRRAASWGWSRGRYRKNS